MTTYDEDGGYPHPDHVMCHRISLEAFDAAGDPDWHPELGDPWQPLKLYYHMTFSRPRVTALHEGLLAAGLESPFGEWLTRWDTSSDKGQRITTRVECADYFEVRDQALLAHATQVDPDGFWFRVPLEIQRKVWPTEDYQLVRSLVDSAVAENDLGDTRSGSLAGPMGLFIILLMAVATVLLIRNMNARIRRLPDQFPDQTPAGRQQTDGLLADSRAAESHEPQRNTDDQHAQSGT